MAADANGLSKNSIISAEIERVSENGDGIGSAPDGKVIFCFGALPGETAEMIVIKVSKSYYIGKLLRVAEGTWSPLRSEPGCDVYARCGGCVLRHAAYSLQLELKEKYVHDCLKRIGGISDYIAEPIIPSEETEHYRNKSMYHFSGCHGKDGGSDGKNIKLECGFFRRNSHEVVDCGDCLEEDRLAALVRRSFLKIAIEFGFDAYDEQTGDGLLRNLMIRTSHSRGEAMAVIVINGDLLPYGGQVAAKLTSVCPFLVSIYVNINKSRFNNILGDKFVLLSGEPYLEDSIGDAEFMISPQSFFQVNPLQTLRLYEKAFELAEPKEGDVILDIYCGIGTIGIFFADKCRRIGAKLGGLLGIEYTVQAIRDARLNAERNGVLENAVFIAGDASRVLPSLCGPYQGDDSGFTDDIKAATLECARELCKSSDIIILDPPRKGCGEALIRAAAVCSPEKIVYVSCNPATLARDVKLFVELGYEVRKVCPVDMFPNAGHVETVVLMSKKDT